MSQTQNQYWLMKSEPSAFGIADLAAKKEAFWDGIRNYQVRNLLRDEMRVGDRALFYHSSCSLVGVAGEMRIAGVATVDQTQFDPKSEYYDAKSSPAAPRWLGVPVHYERTFPHLVTLYELRREPSLTGLRILARGNRLSVTQVTRGEFERIVTLGTRV